jgi:hypothetical protein
MEDCDASQSAAIGSKKSRGAPEGKKRIRLSVGQKAIAMKHFEENLGMSYPKLIDWCFEKFGMEKKISESTMSHWFSVKAGKWSQRLKIKEAMESNANSFRLAAKSFHGTHFPDLERQLPAWLDEFESQEAYPSED